MKMHWLVLLLVAVPIVGCSRFSSPGPGGPQRTAPNEELVREGQPYFAEWGCVDCHGDAGEGTEGAPALADLRRKWNLDELVRYLNDPALYGETNARIRELQESYEDIEMPAFDLPEGQRRALASWLLATSVSTGLPRQGDQ